MISKVRTADFLFAKESRRTVHMSKSVIPDFDKSDIFGTPSAPREKEPSVQEEYRDSAIEEIRRGDSDWKEQTLARARETYKKDGQGAGERRESHSYANADEVLPDGAIVDGIQDDFSDEYDYQGVASNPSREFYDDSTFDDDQYSDGYEDSDASEKESLSRRVEFNDSDHFGGNFENEPRYDDIHDPSPEEYGSDDSYGNEIYEEASDSSEDLDDDSGFSSVGFFYGERAVKPASEAKGFFGEVSSEDGAFYDDIADDDEDSIGDSDMYGVETSERSRSYTPDVGVSDNPNDYDEDSEYYGSHSAKKPKGESPISTRSQEESTSGVTSIEEMLKAWDTSSYSRGDQSDDAESTRDADSDSRADKDDVNSAEKPSPYDDVWSQMVSEFGNIIGE